MLKNVLLLSLVALTGITASAYRPLTTHIHTKWADEVSPENVWNVYPRPIMERDEWQNLNGLWNYSISEIKSTAPAKYDGEILVPFAIESDLSGVGKTPGPDNVIWYNRSFSVPSSWKGQDVMLNFGAVDWACDVWVNDFKVGSHKGGYTPFSINITAALNKKGDNTLTVKVFDPTDAGYQPIGKQVNKPNGIWYTSVSGIWQTVWIEPVAKNHISGIRTVPDIDNNTITVDISQSRPEPGTVAEVQVFDGDDIVATGKSINGQPVVIDMPADAKLWSPGDPNLYDLTISLSVNGRKIDSVKSYTAMRKISTGKDKDGIVRLQLNNKPLFQFGPLDQGWWPDGLYTAPTYEALVYDVDKTLEWGFNMIRKHVKVEPAVWYTYCDRKGILVWQDMPCGDYKSGAHEWQMYSYYDGKEFERSPESESVFRREWQDIMDALYNYPCIVTWIPFNEHWGQFKTEEIVQWTKAYDPSRLVNPASGGNHFATGDMLDIHHYPGPKLKLIDSSRATVLGEYGGIGMVVKDHVWTPDHNWGYTRHNDSKAVSDQYVGYTNTLLELVPVAYSAGVYTQTTDVEIEVNGLMTYDRKVIKIDEDRVREANRKLCDSLSKQ